MSEVQFLDNQERAEQHDLDNNLKVPSDEKPVYRLSEEELNRDNPVENKGH